MLPGKSLLLISDHYVNVLSSGLPYLTARSYREPTTTAKRIGCPACRTTSTSAVYGTSLRVHLGWSTVTTARSYRGPTAIAKRLFSAMVPFSNGPLISGKPLPIDHYVHVLSSGLPYLTARSYREPTTIAKRLGWSAHIRSPRKLTAYVLCPLPFRLPVRRGKHRRVGRKKHRTKPKTPQKNDA